MNGDMPTAGTKSLSDQGDSVYWTAEAWAEWQVLDAERRKLREALARIEAREAEILAAIPEVAFDEGGHDAR